MTPGASSAISMLTSRLERKLRLIDVGARWGVSWQFAALGTTAESLCFEPDPEECARLVAASTPGVTYLPFALAEAAGELELTITAEPACSSTYKPRQRLHEVYPALWMLRPERTVTVAARPLDAVLSDQGMPGADLIKLDTQGSELDILRGAEACLRHCLAIDIEVEFNPLYENQALFCDVDRFLRDRGFALWRLTDIVHYAEEKSDHSPALIAHAWPGRVQEMNPGDGQVFWAQAHYVRASLTPAESQGTTLDEPVVAATAVAALGHWDLARHILKENGQMALAELVWQALSASATAEPAPPPADPAPPSDSALPGRIAALEAELQALRASRSWRITEPLRRLSRWLPRP